MCEIYSRTWGSQPCFAARFLPIITLSYMCIGGVHKRIQCWKFFTFASSSSPYQLVTLDPRVVDNCQYSIFYRITLGHTLGKMSILSSVQYYLAAGVVVLIIVFAARTIYSVYFGPLSKFPGPKIAAATLCYEFYYDVLLQGQYTFKIRELHEKYGLSQALQITLSKSADDASLRPNYSNQSLRTSYRWTRLLWRIVFLQAAE